MGSGNVKGQPAPIQMPPMSPIKLPETKQLKQLAEALNFFKSGQFQKALAFLKNIAILKPSAEVHQKLGQLLREVKIFDLAKEYFEKALKESPLNTSILRDLSLLSFDCKQYQKSLNYLKKAFLIDSTELETINMLIIAECKTGSMKQAIQHFDNVVQKIG